MSFILSALGLIAATQVITAANPVHSIFFLILVFSITSVRRLLLSMEFMALAFLMVYVGAIAVLFLFVIRRLNAQPETKDRPLGNIPRLVGVARLFRFTRWSNVFPTFSIPSFLNEIDLYGANILKSNVVSYLDKVGSVSGGNMNTIGQVLYTKYFIGFLMAGLVLLVSRIGAILLTLSTSVSLTGPSAGSGSNNVQLIPALRQQVHQQHSRDADRAIFRIK